MFLTSDAYAPMVRAAGARAFRYELPDDEQEALFGIPASAAPLAELLDATARCSPDVLAFDSTMWLTGRALAARWQCPAVQFTACFASNTHFSLIERIGAARQREHQPSSPPGPEPFLARLAAFTRSLGLPAGQEEALLRQPEEDKIVFLPRAFQYAGDTFGDGYAFVGPCVNDRPATGNWAPPGDGRPVALISLGTSAYNQRPEFFRDCARAFDGLHWQVVMTLGGGVRPDQLGSLPPGVEVHDFIPHPLVLPHAAAFVTAAGMGSVMESLSFGTPLVMVPQHGEQAVNAARVAELGLGRILPALSPARVRDAVLAVAASEDIAANLAVMRREFLAAGGAAEAADRLEARAQGAAAA
jgi:MGT family glycosyltransferase